MNVFGALVSENVPVMLVIAYIPAVAVCTAVNEPELVMATTESEIIGRRGLRHKGQGGNGSE